MRHLFWKAAGLALVTWANGPVWNSESTAGIQDSSWGKRLELTGGSRWRPFSLNSGALRQAARFAVTSAYDLEPRAARASSNYA